MIEVEPEVEYSMNEVDSLLDLKRGSANYYRTRGVFEAVRRGRAWVIRESELPAVSEAINLFISRPDPADAGTMFTPAEAALRLGLALTTIYNQMERGMVQSIRRPNGRRYIPLESIERYRRNHMKRNKD